jgi:hypothetical protein
LPEDKAKLPPPTVFDEPDDKVEDPPVLASLDPALIVISPPTAPVPEVIEPADTVT